MADFDASEICERRCVKERKRRGTKRLWWSLKVSQLMSLAWLTSLDAARAAAGHGGWLK